ncbi:MULTISPECIES: Hcp family type VI secretion system effector [Pseudomonas]|jgi:type VI secretion system Hcp family effector|uniref:Hcp family type VI secretion system effector n=1 Tax=Pseudomonas folii TaxID=2762593 RepID=A0ABR7B4L5_9PSED|nr:MULTISPECIES: Hcp family type VI secretion system effector [Pseudomonas]MBC3952129.1 Hcp family type VI secretion system effector [Pseudomonas folii]
MAHPIYMTIKGKEQGDISAGCSTPESMGNKCQEAHLNEIMVLSYTHQMANVANIDRATHMPVVITKNIDKSSPLLAQALAQRESITCKIDFYRTTPNGSQEKFYSVEIKEAVIENLLVQTPHVTLDNDAEPVEQLAIRYGDISWTHHAAGTSGYSYWGES